VVSLQRIVTKAETPSTKVTRFEVEGGVHKSSKGQSEVKRAEGTHESYFVCCVVISNDIYARMRGEQWFGTTKSKPYAHHQFHQYHARFNVDRDWEQSAVCSHSTPLR
jgi:hypothetical protein